MSNQQKDNPSSGSTGAGGQGLRQKAKDDTGGPRGDQLSNAVGAAAAGGTGLGEAASAGDTRTGTIPPPANKGGASKA